MTLLGYLKRALGPNNTSRARKSTLKGVPTPRTEDEKKARKLELSSRVKGYEWSELEALAEEMLEYSISWDMLAESDFID